MGRVRSVSVLPSGVKAPESAMTLLGDMVVHVRLGGLIDRQVEITHLKMALVKLDRTIDQIRTKVGNPGFRNNAPSAVVEKKELKLEDQIRAWEKLRTQIVRLTS